MVSIFMTCVKCAQAKPTCMCSSLKSVSELSQNSNIADVTRARALPRIRVGKKQTIETLINEEALLFGKYLENEKKEWVPRVGLTA